MRRTTILAIMNIIIIVVAWQYFNYFVTTELTINSATFSLNWTLLTVQKIVYWESPMSGPASGMSAPNPFTIAMVFIIIANMIFIIFDKQIKEKSKEK